MAKPNHSLPITVGCNQNINHMAFDGCNYYCTIRCEYGMIKLDECLNIIRIFDTCREYNCICYDFCEHCFWASSRGCYNRIFKLDCQMNEIDCLCIRGIENQGEITGISYRCCSDTLIVSFNFNIYEVEKCRGEANALLSTDKAWIVDVLSLCPGMIIIIFRDCYYYIEVFDGCNKKTNSYCLNDRLCPKDLIFNPCKHEQKCLHFDLFALKNQYYPYILSYGVSLNELGFTPCQCNFDICDECCCNCSSCDPKDACADVLESIALIETALAHILNAEGEKIQKVLAATDDLDKILCVNREVNKTIVSATHLEQVLHAKLSTLCDCEICEDFCHEPCDCHNCIDENMPYDYKADGDCTQVK